MDEPIPNKDESIESAANRMGQQMIQGLGLGNVVLWPTLRKPLSKAPGKGQARTARSGRSSHRAFRKKHH